MKTRHSPIRTLAFAAVACAIAGNACAADTPTSIEVDARAPLAATLMPTVSVTANAEPTGTVRMHVADALPLAVTLLPTVTVTAEVSRARTAALIPVSRAIDGAPERTCLAYVDAIEAIEAEDADAGALSC